MPPAAYDPTATFGDYLRFLRRRSQLTQSQLSIAVGYSPGQISMLENGQRTPDIAAVAALFAPALGLENDPHAAARLLRLAQAAGNPAHLDQSSKALPMPGSVLDGNQEIIWQREELGVLEEIPAQPVHWVDRPAIRLRIEHLVYRERLVALYGLPGMGKSCLAAACAANYQSRNPVLWITLHEYSLPSPDLFLRQLALFAVAYAPYASYTSPLARHLAGQGVPLDAGQLLLAIEAALAQLSAPLLVIDDAHLLTLVPDTFLLLRRLLPRTSTLHVLLPSREEIDLPGLHHLSLRGLEPAETSSLVALLFPQPTDIHANNLEQLQAETGGNPLLIRLAATHSQESGASTLSGQPTAAGALVHSLFSALSPSARLLLDFLALWRGSVNLTASELADLLGAVQEGYEHDGGLTEIRRRRTIDTVEQAQLHPLLRDTLLAELQRHPARFRRIHRLAGDWAAYRGEWTAGARHYAQAGSVEAACDLLLAEGHILDRADGLAAVDDLLLICRRNQALPSQQERLRELLLLRGDLLIHTTRAEEARESYRQALESTNGRLAQAKLSERLAVSFFETGRAQDALDLCEEALKLVTWDLSAEGVRLRLQLGGAQVKALIALSRFAEAAILCQKGQDAAKLLRLVKSKAADEVVANSHYALGYIARVLGDLDEARKHFLQSVRYARSAYVQDVEAGSLAYLAVIQREMGDLPGAVESADSAMVVAASIGNDYLRSGILHIQSISAYWQDDLTGALVLSHQARALKEAMLDVEGVIGCDILQGLVLSALGDLPAAKARLAEGLLQCRLVDNGWLQGIALYVQGVVLALGGALDQAEASIDDALSLTGFVADAPYRASALLYRGIIHLAQGKTGEAQAALDESLPPGAAMDILLLHDLLQAMLCYAIDDQPRMFSILEQLSARSQATGHLVYHRESLRLAAIAPQKPALAQLPGLVSCLVENVSIFSE